MKKIIKLISLLIVLFLSISYTLAFYTLNDKIENNFFSKDYNLIIYGNGGTFTNASVSIINGKTTLPTPSLNGYNFVGFSESLNGAAIYTTQINNIDDINNKELYAKWSAADYTITYNLNGGSIIGQPTTYNIESTFTLPYPTKNGYTFTGWTGTGLSSVTKDVTVSGGTGNRTYTANWTPTNYSITYNLNGGSITGQPTTYNIESNITLPTPTRTGYTFAGWTGTGLSSATKTVTIKNATGNRTYTATWTAIKYTVDVNSIIQDTTYNSGLSGFTFSVWVDGTKVATNVIDYNNKNLTYGQKIRIVVNARDGYNIKSFTDKTWTVTSSFNINPKWYDDIPPTITKFNVKNLGYYNASIGARGGFNVYIYIDAYDNGTGIDKFQTWLKPYKNGSGSGRKDGQERTIKQVLYIEEPEGRTFCAYAIDKAGNESEKCATLHIDE